MFAQAKRPQLAPTAAPAAETGRSRLLPRTAEPPGPLPNPWAQQSAPTLEAPPSTGVQLKAGCESCGGSGNSDDDTPCPTCQAKAAPTLEKPPTDAQARRGTPSEDPAERQADDLGQRIGDDLAGTESVSHGSLPPAVQSVAESHLGVSLGNVQLDAGSGGQRKAKDQQALAVTEGQHIAFGDGQLSTGSAEGRALLGHELVHVAQQGAAGRHAAQRVTDEALTVPKDETLVFSGTGLSLDDIKNDEAAKITAIRFLLGLSPLSGATTAPAPQGYSFTVAEAWNSFGSDIERVAKANKALWTASRSHVEKIPALASYKLFIELDVLAAARESLNTSETIAKAELEQWTPSSPGPTKDSGSSPSISKKLEALRQALKLIELLTHKRSQLLDITTSEWKKFSPDTPPDTLEDDPLNDETPLELSPLDTDQDADATSDDADEVSGAFTGDLPFLIVGEPASLDPTPATMPTAEPLPPPSAPPLPSWSEVYADWELLSEQINDIKQLYPSAYALHRNGLAQQFFSPSAAPAAGVAAPSPPAPVAPSTSTPSPPSNNTLSPTDAHAQSTVVDALKITLENITKTRQALDDGTLSWSDFEPQFHMLLAGRAAAGRTPWSSPAPRLAAEVAWADAAGDESDRGRLLMLHDVYRRETLEAAKRSSASPGLELTERGSQEVLEKAGNQLGEDIIFIVAVGTPGPVLPMHDDGRLWGMPEPVTAGIRLPKLKFHGVRALASKVGKKHIRAQARRSVIRLSKTIDGLEALKVPTVQGKAMRGLIATGRWEAHHLLPLGVVQNVKFIRILVSKRAYNVNRSSNLSALPTATSRSNIAQQLPAHVKPGARSHATYDRIIQEYANKVQDDLLRWGRKRRPPLKSLDEIVATASGKEMMLKEASRVEEFARNLLNTWMQDHGRFLR